MDNKSILLSILYLSLYKIKMHIFLPRVMNENFNIFVIVFFQFFGTLLFGFMNFNLINQKAKSQSQIKQIGLFYVDFSLSMFMCFAYGRQFSGGVYNPAIIFYRMLRKTDRLTIKIGCIYMLAQFIGAVVGSLIAMELSNIKHAPITGLLPATEQVSQFVTEIIGTCILTFMIQFMIEKKMTFIQHNRQFYIAIPLIFMVARAYSASSNGVNPAFGLSFQLSYSINTGNWQAMEMCYILIIGPYVGAALAVFLFQFGMKPMFPLKREEIQQILQQKLKQKQRIAKQIRKVELQKLRAEQKQANNLENLLEQNLQESSSQSESQQSKLIRKKVNHRWSLNDIITQNPHPMPEYYHLGNLNTIGQAQIDEQIQSITYSEDQYQENFNNRIKIQLDLSSESKTDQNRISNQLVQQSSDLSSSSGEISDYQKTKIKYMIDGEQPFQQQEPNDLIKKLLQDYDEQYQKQDDNP